MIIALAFIITSIFQYIFYYKNYKSGKRVSNFLITAITILIYIIVHPFLGYIFYQKYNYYNMPYIFQVIIIGGLGIIFALITRVFWYFDKENNG